MSASLFKIEERAPQGGARSGVLSTPHGEIHTPAFVPVGTKADVKGIFPSTLEALGAQVALANTYHLYLQPGERIVESAGGLGQFMQWQRDGKIAPTMTDSGGFQVFSLGAAFGKSVSKFIKEDAPTEEGVAVYDEDVATKHGQLAVVDDEGVTFTSHLDGSLHRFTPERSVEIQHALGADLFFAFDECTSPTASYEYQREAMERTHKWAARSLKAHRQNLEANKKQSIFGIVQGGRYEDLRKESAREIASLGFDGIGIGGSFSKEDMRGPNGAPFGGALQAAVGELPEELPRHFLGIGEPGDVLEGIANGMDLFDCVAATRIGRHGSIYTSRGVKHLTGEQFRADLSPFADFRLPNQKSGGVEDFSVAYVAHLIRAKEMLGSIICSMHNVGFILALVDGAREAIQNGRFDEYRENFIRNYYSS